MPSGSVLVTGASGFVGPYAIAALHERGWTAWALSRSGGDVGRARGIAADVTDGDGVRVALERSRPDVVLHLAAQSSVQASFRNPVGTISNNIGGAATLLYAALELEPRPRVIVVGSAEEYGAVEPDDLPIGERQPLAPVSPYGVGKAAQSLLAESLYRSEGLRTVVMRPFNHTGPGQEPRFSIPTFARQVARIEAGLEAPVLRTGNLDTRRDFTDVRDIAAAYALAAETGEPGRAYNLGSGVSVQMRWVVDEIVRRSTVDLRIETDAGRTYSGDIPELRADASAFREASGWAPRIPLEQTLSDVLAYWRAQVRAEETLHAAP